VNAATWTAKMPNKPDASDEDRKMIWSKLAPSDPGTDTPWRRVRPS
jgi:hypothetical protein